MRVGFCVAVKNLVQLNCNRSISPLLTKSKIKIIPDNSCCCPCVYATTCSMFSTSSETGLNSGQNNKMEKIFEEKSRLRMEMKRRLATITVEEKERQSEVVRNMIYDHPIYKSSERISIFLNMDDEIRTLDVLKQMFEDGKTVFIPRYSGKLGRMDMVLLTSWEDYENLPVTRWNIKQPLTDDDRPDALLTGGLDLVIAPGLAFTTKGNRLGRGKGYYDAFLTRAAACETGKPYVLAVAFKQQILPHIPTTEKDYIIDEVAHED